MLRALGKTCLACAYTWSGAGRILRRKTRSLRLPFIVCYHRVVEDFAQTAQVAIPSLLISKKMLERHIDWLGKRFSFASLDEIGSMFEADRPFHRPVAALTFDDGYSDVYHNAYPILRRKGIPAAIFTVTGYVDTGRAQIFDRLYLVFQVLHRHDMPLARTLKGALRSAGANAADLRYIDSKNDDPLAVLTVVLGTLPNGQIDQALGVLEAQLSLPRAVIQQTEPMTWDMIETMHRGGMTIGSHTKSHLLLTGESEETIRTELVESKHTLESRLKSRIAHFAYPDGRFNPMVVQAVKAAGYRYGYGICGSRDAALPAMTIPRKVLWERSCLNALGRFSPAVMHCQTQGVFDSRNECGHDHLTIRKEGRHGTLSRS